MAPAAYFRTYLGYLSVAAKTKHMLERAATYQQTSVTDVVVSNAVAAEHVSNRTISSPCRRRTGTPSRMR